MKRLLLLTMCLALLLAACGTPPDAEPTPLPTLAAPTSLPEGYPAPPPRPTQAPESYPPAPPEPTAEPTAYPDDARAWMLLPAGMQCQEFNVDLSAAVSSLVDAGITVYNSQLVDLMACEACDVCPTSQHYRVLIAGDQVEAARALGWEAEGQ